MGKILSIFFMFLFISNIYSFDIKKCEFPCNYKSIKIKNAVGYTKYILHEELSKNIKIKEELFLNKINYNKFFCSYLEEDNFIKLNNEELVLKCINKSNAIIKIPAALSHKLKKTKIFYYSFKETTHNLFKKLGDSIIRVLDINVFWDINRNLIFSNYYFYSRYTGKSNVFKYLKNKEYPLPDKIKYYLNINKIRLLFMAKNICKACNLKYKDIIEFRNKQCFGDNCTKIELKIPSYVLNMENFYIINKEFKGEHNLKNILRISINSYTGDLLEFLLDINISKF